MQAYGRLGSRNLNELFDLFDVDGNRELDFDEFQSLMRKKAGLVAGEVSGGELRTLFAAMDIDENGSVSLEEFQTFVSYR